MFTSFNKFVLQLKRQLNDAHAEEKNCSAETERKDKEMLEAERILKAHQFEFRSAQEKLKNLTDMMQELASEHSRLELELADRREKLDADNGVLCFSNQKIFFLNFYMDRNRFATI